MWPLAIKDTAELVALRRAAREGGCVATTSE